MCCGSALEGTRLSGKTETLNEASEARVDWEKCK